ncbi:HEXXH motif domain-containing protein [Streptomyces sp. ADMS]|uniref:HEXXH motif domain-containing protein n=1 Tax=Streptomyces sp. ADMS TaxID=3071415 RepID=UPI00296EC384|nr:HEXXH motif domain-containing protein [Streptomyces sp. ADMS]MDW4905630.1 HEXXH motif domain-containing protein [Streptomyces sp. ADMS]
MRLHELSAPVLRALNSTTEDEVAVAALLDAEHSRRLLLVRAIMDACAGTPEADAVDAEEAWRLLEAAQKLDAAAFRAMLLDPQVGLWAATLLRRLSRTGEPSGAGAGPEGPLRVELGFLMQMAAAVSVTVGADFGARVPVRDGQVFLPGLGRATVGSGEPWDTAEMRALDGVVRVSSGGMTVTLPSNPESDAPGWEGLRRLRTGRDGVSLTLTLDDLGPYLAVPGLPTAGRLTADAFADWQRWFSDMWPLLVDDHRAGARALSAGLLSVVPLPRGERLRARAASSSDAFGCVLLSEPDMDAADLPEQLGVALVHEFRHTLLNGLIFLMPLFEECDELFHAPWRDDPRPLGGLVHGAYAFSGVARYWRTRGTKGLEGFEFALWREAVREVLGTLHGHPALTLLGRQLVEALAEQTGPWQEDAVGEHEQRLASLAAGHHHATWRAHHLNPPPAHVEALALAWETNAPVCPPAGTGFTSDLRPDPLACRLDALALLARLSIIDPAEFERLRGEEDPALRVPGVGPADLALVGGDAEAALGLYADELAGPDARPAAWAGLGLALTETGARAAGAALVRNPEVARAVSRSLPTPPDPVALAHWLAG